MQEAMQMLALKTVAVANFFAAASSEEMEVMSDLIRLGFSLEWTTDHETMLAERVGMGTIDKTQKNAITEAFGEMAAELTDYHS